jgi:hypothetical protein
MNKRLFCLDDGENDLIGELDSQGRLVMRVNYDTVKLNMEAASELKKELENYLINTIVTDSGTHTP